MKNWKIISIAILAVVTAALLVSSVAAMVPFGGFGGMMGGGYNTGGYGGGMMGYGYGPYINQQTPTQTGSQATYPFQFGGGCLGRSGFRGYAAPNINTGSTPLTIDTAATVTKNYIAALGNPDLVVKQVEEYANNFYVQVNEVSTGKGAFELLINKQTGSIYPEMGPNMMWNTKYGMMRSGALGGIFGTATTTMTVTQTQATTNAQTYLNSYISGATTGDVNTFYGYYTVEVLNGAAPYGMLSVNGYSGQVWFHSWHGTFIAELQVS